MKELLKKLTETASPSGYESRVREVIKTEISSYSKDIRIDALGNLIVRVGEKTAQGLRIMVAAHMDEIGLIVSHVEKNGLVRFSNLGTIFPRYLAQRSEYIDTQSLGRIVLTSINNTFALVPIESIRITKAECDTIDVGRYNDVSFFF